MKASVVICTYNRSKLLEETIQSVQKQDFPLDQYEIIVVDNNSTDETKDVVAEMAKASSVRIKYVFEGKQGLSHARNAGINNSEGEIIIFTDDDVEAERSWLRELVAAFDTPEVAAAGGPIRPIWLGGRPEWLTDSWQGYFTVSDFPEARETGEFRSPNYPWGANMAFRRSILKETDLFSPALGRIGDCLLSNEELRLFRAIEEMGHRIVLAPDAVIHHKIPPERLKKLWLYHRTYWQGRSMAILDQQSGDYVYSRLRTFSSGMFWGKLLNDKTEFEKKCLDRIITGYLYQLLQADGGVYEDFKRLRVLETFLENLTKTAVSIISERHSQMQGIVAQNNEALKQKDEMILLKSDQLAQKDTLISQKNEQLAKQANLVDKLREQTSRDRETILDLEKRLKDHEEQFRQKCEELIEVDNKFKVKCVEVVSKDKELMQACEELSGEKQRFEEELRLRDERIADLLNSMSWKITSPLRAIYGILLRQKK